MWFESGWFQSWDEPSWFDGTGPSIVQAGSMLFYDVEIEVVRIILNKRDGSGTTLYEFAREFWWPNSIYSGNGVVYPLLVESPQVNRLTGLNVAPEGTTSVRLYANAPLDFVNQTFADLLMTHDYHNGSLEIRYYCKPDYALTTHSDAVNIRQTLEIVDIRYSSTDVLELTAREVPFNNKEFGHRYVDSDFGVGVDAYKNTYSGEKAPVVFGDSVDGSTGIIASACPLTSSELISDGSGNTYQSIKLMTGIGVTGSFPTKGKLYVKNPNTDLDSRQWLELSTGTGAYSGRTPYAGPNTLSGTASFAMHQWRMARKVSPGSTARMISGCTARLFGNGTVSAGAGQLMVTVREAIQDSGGYWNAGAKVYGQAVFDGTVLNNTVTNYNFFFPEPVILVPGKTFFFILEWTNSTDTVNRPNLQVNTGVLTDPTYTNDQTVSKDGWTETAFQLQLQIWDFGADTAYGYFASGSHFVQTLRIDSWASGVNPYLFGGMEFKVGSRGLRDDGLGTYTGTPGAIMENPASIVHFLLRNQTLGLGLSFYRADYAAIDATRGYVGTGTLKAAAAIESDASVGEVIATLCNQFRMRLYRTRTGKVSLNYPVPVTVGTLDVDVSEADQRVECALESFSESPETEIVNSIDLLYKPDSLSVNSDPALARKIADSKYTAREYIHDAATGDSVSDSFRATASTASQALYGLRAALWKFDWIVRPDVARKVLNYFFDRKSFQSKLVTVRVARRQWYSQALDLFSRARVRHTTIPNQLLCRFDEPTKTTDGSGTLQKMYLDGVPVSGIVQGEIVGEVSSIREEGPWITMTIEQAESFSGAP